MNGNASLLRVMLFVKWNRIRKKAGIYKQATRVLIDVTTAIYLLFMVGYLIAGAFIMGDFIHTYQPYFRLIEEQAIARYWLIAGLLPLRYTFQSFRHPGVLFSATEGQLSNLPFLRKNIWLFCVIEQWLKQLLLYIILGTLVILLTSISASVVGAYILLFFVMSIIMTIPQWKLFQLKFLHKCYWLAGMLACYVVGLFINPMITGIGVIVLMLLINLALANAIFRSIHWGRVMEISDFNIWNMPFMGSVTKTKFQRQRKYSVFKNSASRKKPFPYTAKAIYSRMWRIYLLRHVDLAFKVVGLLVVFLIVVFLIAVEFFPVAVAVAIYSYTSVIAVLFKERFQTDLLHILPWALKAYKKTYFKWVMICSLPLLIPVTLYFIVNGSMWAPAQFILYAGTFLLVCDVKIEKAKSSLAKESESQISGAIGTIFLILTAISSWYPVMSLSFIVIIGMRFYGRKSQQ